MATRFAELESVLRFIFGTVFQLSMDDATILVSKMGNEAAVTLMRQKLESSPLGSFAEGHVAHFLKGFEGCKEMRDHLMHSGLAWTGESGQNLFYKTNKQGRTLISAPTLFELRSVADDIVHYADYGRMLGNAINNSSEKPPTFPESAFPWPDKPQAPTKLIFSADAIEVRSSRKTE